MPHESDVAVADVIEVAGKKFVIEQWHLDGPSRPPFFGCGSLLLRQHRLDLIDDIIKSQGPEWRT